MTKLRLVCISDTHTKERMVEIPKGDIIVHAGDATFRGYKHEVLDFAGWYRDLDFKHKIFVAGNHDTVFEDNHRQGIAWLHTKMVGNTKMPRLDRKDGQYLPLAEQDIIYLQDSAVELEVNGVKLKFYGAPWQPEFCNWAFNLDRGAPLKEKWDRIPKDTDILITHGPSYKNCDTLSELGSQPGEHIGCRELRSAILRVNPLMHVCGHIH